MGQIFKHMTQYGPAYSKYHKCSYKLFFCSEVMAVSYLLITTPLPPSLAPGNWLDFQYQALFPSCCVGLEFNYRAVGYHQCLLTTAAP